MPAFLKQRRTLLIIASFAAIALVGLTAFFVFTQTQSVNDSQSNSATETNKATESAKNGDNISNVTWQWSGSEWLASGTPPSCSSPLLTDLPVNINLVTSILYPGQVRGGDYKAHGGFRFDNNPDTKITVAAPLDAVVTEGSRYLESGEVQYFFTFINSCGVAYQFDHLVGLSDSLQQAANKFPEAKPDDSRTTPINPPLKVSKGEILATSVGHSGNVFVDFGVYDLRSTNEASKTPGFAAQYNNPKQFIYHGVCWLKELPTQISQKVLALPGSGENAKTSDYCK